jgi:hypothetical protein
MMIAGAFTSAGAHQEFCTIQEQFWDMKMWVSLTSRQTTSAAVVLGRIAGDTILIQEEAIW